MATMLSPDVGVDMKYKCASDSLRPGQLDRMVAKIKDCKPEINAIKELKKQGHTLNCAIRQISGDGLCECRVKYPLKIGK